MPGDPDREREERRRERELRRRESELGRAGRDPRPPTERRIRSFAPRLVAVGALLVGVAVLTALVTGPSGQGHGAQRPDGRAPGPRSHARAGPLLSAARSRDAKVPILMYHVIGVAPPSVPFPELWVAPRTFAAETGALARAGFHAVTLAEVFAAWRRHARLPPRPIVLSFDDGYLGDATHAAPVLAARHWPGVLNLVMHNLGPGNLPRSLVTRIAREGWEIDAHTIHHLDLTTLASAQLRRELVAPRALIRRDFGQSASFLCYPAGRYDPAVEQAARRAGYTAATTEAPGWATPAGDPFALPRVRVNGSDTPRSLLTRIRALAPHA